MVDKARSDIEETQVEGSISIEDDSQLPSSWGPFKLKDIVSGIRELMQSFAVRPDKIDFVTFGFLSNKGNPLPIR